MRVGASGGSDLHLGISLWPNLGKAGVGLRPERCQESLSWVERRDGQSQEDSMGCGGR